MLRWIMLAFGAMSLAFSSGWNRRFKKPVRLMKTWNQVLHALNMLAGVLVRMVSAICYAIVPPPVKQETVKPWLQKLALQAIHGVKAWCYALFARWHIDQRGGYSLPINGLV